MWHYKELISCPLVLVLGKFTYGDLTGFVSLPVLNLRVSILVTNSGEHRVVSNVSNEEWLDKLYRVCSAVLSGNISSLNDMEKIEATSMIYGGLGLYSTIDGNAECVSLDYVNTKSFYFYLTPSKLNGSYAEARLEDWVALQFALRAGLKKTLHYACSNISRDGGEVCAIKSSHGLLRITSSRTPPWGGCTRVIPDNSPLRHVIALTDDN
ncbi:MAG: hypothetical protein QXK88_01150 [Desulfurococcaceae archaeon]